MLARYCAVVFKKSKSEMNFMADIQIDRDVWQLIQAFDRDRDRDILSRKYEKLQKNAFAFFVHFRVYSTGSRVVQVQ